jgi:hypothetical protein
MKDMDTFQALWADIMSYMQTGFTQINAVQGLLIAIVAAYFLHRWGNVFAVAVGATVVHIIFDVMLPVLANGAQFRLPPLMDGSYWNYVLALYVGYLLVITVFYIVKRVILNREYHPA